MSNHLTLIPITGLVLLTLAGCTTAPNGIANNNQVSNSTTNISQTNTARNSGANTPGVHDVSNSTETATFTIPSLKSLNILSDTEASTGWSPMNLQQAKSKIESLLQSGVITNVKMPKEPTGLQFNGNIGPSRLNIVTTTGSQVSIFPAYYLAKGKVDQNGNQLYTTKFVQNVLEVVQNGKVTYLFDNPLYTWLKTDQWKEGFSSSVHQ